MDDKKSLLSVNGR